MEKDVPLRLAQSEFDKDPLLHKFILIFDREGYSPEFILKMKNKNIACLTYNKYPKDDWVKEEFSMHKVKLHSGELVEMQLAERGVFLGKKVWVREVRRLMDGGHQTSIISTAYRLDLIDQAAGMFARWSQENFFKYMRQHYNLDRLAEYNVEEISEAVKVVNPNYRKLDGEVRKKVGLLNRKLGAFGSITIEEGIESAKVEEYQKRKSILQEEILVFQKEIEGLKKKRKETERHIQLSELPKEEKFQRLRSQSKDFLDTIKMIAYRAETSMVSILRESMTREDDARSLVRCLYQATGDLIPDENLGLLKIRLHSMTNQSSNETIKKLCAELNESETIFPGTNLRLFYELVSL